MRSLTHEEALERIKEDAGTILDPSLVEVFIRIMTEDLSQK
jgi:HD-GYP domain-containing protein (c-di-GMP phosphodiesterase class II)